MLLKEEQLVLGNKNPLSKEETTREMKNKNPLAKEETKEKRRTRREIESGGGEIRCKKQRVETEMAGESDLFDALPDDLVVFILSKLSSSAESRSDLVNVLMT